MDTYLFKVTLRPEQTPGGVRLLLAQVSFKPCTYVDMYVRFPAPTSQGSREECKTINSGEIESLALIPKRLVFPYESTSESFERRHGRKSYPWLSKVCMDINFSRPKADFISPNIKLNSQTRLKLVRIYFE